LIATPLTIEEEVIEEKVVFELAEEVVATSTPEVSENELIQITELIRNINVEFEIVSPVKDIEFMFTKPTSVIQEIEVIDHKVVEQPVFSFDLPVAESKPKVDDYKILFDLSEETKDIKVNEAVEFIPITEQKENGVIKYSLEEYMEIENELLNSKPAAVVTEPINAELDIKVKQVEAVEESQYLEAISPMEMSIEESLKIRADERRRKLKEFNYKFHNNPSRIDEFEKEPAYKRSGIDITTNQTSNNNSRMSIGTDSNDDVQLRSNNSFLHDNVD
jgi:cell division protein FtsZ